MTDLALDRLPSWLREIDVALAANPHLLVTGNLRDIVLLDRRAPDGKDLDPRRSPPPRMASIVEALLAVLAAAGHTDVVVAHPADGARAALDTGTAAALVRGAGPAAEFVEHLPALLRAVSGSQQPCCLIIDGASRLTPEADFTEPAMHRALVAAEQAMATARRVDVPGPHRTALYNTVIWLLDRENDLPHWLVQGELARVVSIPPPGMAHRLAMAAALVSSLPQAPDKFAEADRYDAIVRGYASRTAGLTLRSLREINRLAIDRQIPAEDIGDAVRTFRVGIPDTPWRDPALRDRIRAGVDTLGDRVLGQPAAIRKSVDILIRSAMGLTGAQKTGDDSRPQGVLFFAGPTGVGKTELAKSISELVFGRDDAFARFDMSEFSSEHAEARLIGAPPGYTGHSAGGELTNAVRQKPFQLLLFDEIEKAHPRILDKFLQILEEGRLTDGTGATVFFSETLVVFTSNLGVYRTERSGERVPVVTRGSDYDTVERKIRTAVGDHFTKEIGRPELLNRIGDNIVVFDFISEGTAHDLAHKFTDNVCAQVRAVTGIEVTVGDAARAQLVETALAKLDFGGRGVSTTIESLLVNPLARALFDLPEPAAAVTVERLEQSAQGWTVVTA